MDKEPILLNKILSTYLQPLPPFSLQKTVCQPLKPPQLNESYENEVFWFTLNLLDKPIGAKIESLGSVDNPKLKLTIYSNSQLSQKENEFLLREIKRGLGVNESLNEFYESAKDPLLKDAIKNRYGMKMYNFGNIYEMFIALILNQNTTIQRATKMGEALCQTFGKKLIFNGKTLYVFPKLDVLAKVTEEGLRALKLGYRAKYIKNVTESFINQKINEFELRKKNNTEALKAMAKMKGVGEYTAKIALRECLRRWDEIVLDVWSQKKVSKILFGKEDVSKQKIEEEVRKRWGKKYVGLALRYILENLYKFENYPKN